MEERTETLLPPLHLPGLTPHQALVVEYTWVAMAVCILLVGFVAFTRKRIPTGVGNAIEFIIQFLEDFTADIVGPKGLVYFPLISTIFFFILVSNYIGLIPGFISPTAHLSTTAAFAIIVFVFYQVVGFQKQGFKYLKHFLGPIPWLAPLMVPMEIISQFARPFSLSVRLFANIMAGEVIIGKILFPLAPLMLPVIWMVWESLITAPFQAFVFSLLTMIYLAGVIASDDHDEH